MSNFLFQFYFVLFAGIRIQYHWGMGARVVRGTKYGAYTECMCYYQTEVLLKYCIQYCDTLISHNLVCKIGLKQK